MGKFREYLRESEVNEKISTKEGSRESLIITDNSLSDKFNIHIFDIDDLVNVNFNNKKLFECDLQDFKVYISSVNEKIKNL